MSASNPISIAQSSMTDTQGEEAQRAGVEGEEGRQTIVRLTAASSARRLHASEHLDYLGTLLGYTHTSTHIHSHIHTHSLWFVNISCCHSVLSVRKHQAEFSMFLSKMFTRNYNVDPFIAVGRLECRVYIISKCLPSSQIWSKLTYWKLVLADVQFCLLMKGICFLARSILYYIFNISLYIVYRDKQREREKAR